MSSTASLFSIQRRHTWVKTFDRLSGRADADKHRKCLIYALTVLSDEMDSLCHTRNEICHLADIGINKYLDGMRWLKSLGAIEEVPEPMAWSGRRIVLVFKRDPNFVPLAAPGSEANPSISSWGGAPQKARLARLSETGRRAFPKPEGAPKRARPPIRESGMREEERENVPSPTPSQPATPSAPETQPTDETGRDGLSSTEAGEGLTATSEASAEEIAAAIAGHEANLQEIVGRAGSQSAAEKHPAHRQLYRMETAAIERLRSGDHSELRPPPPRVIAPAPPPLPIPPPRVDRDETYPLASGLALVKALDDPGWTPATAERFAVHFARRWRDVDDNGLPRPDTIELFRAAALNLGGECLAALVRENDRAKIRQPARRFSVAVANALKAHRARKRRPAPSLGVQARP